MTESSATPPVPGEFVPRLLARGIDVVVLVGIDVGLGLLIGFGFGWLAIAATIVVAYFTLLDSLAGATLGKLALGLRVTAADGRRCASRWSARRSPWWVRFRSSDPCWPWAPGSGLP